MKRKVSEMENEQKVLLQKQKEEILKKVQSEKELENQQWKIEKE